MGYRFWVVGAVCAAGCALDSSPIVSRTEGRTTSMPVTIDADGALRADPASPAPVAAGTGPFSGSAAAGAGGEAPSGGSDAGGQQIANDTGTVDAAADLDTMVDGGADAGQASDAAASEAGTADGQAPDEKPPLRFQSSCSSDTDCAQDELCVVLGVTGAVSYCSQVCREDLSCDQGDSALAPVCVAGIDGRSTCSLPCQLTANATCPNGMVCVPDPSSLVTGLVGLCAFFE